MTTYRESHTIIIDYWYVKFVDILFCISNDLNWLVDLLSLLMIDSDTFIYNEDFHLSHKRYCRTSDDQRILWQIEKYPSYSL